MPSLDSERVGIVGLGAIGGSLALALQGRARLLAWSRDQRDREAAGERGISVGREDAWAAEMSDSTAVIVAVPLDEVPGVAAALLPHLADTSLVMHVASLQRREALGLSEPDFQRVLGTHPIAGSERAGFRGANDSMFRGATLRAEARASETVRRRIEMLWSAVGVTHFVWDDASRHDALMAWISHLPQLAATALASVLAEEGLGAREVGSGARDTTRLAASDSDMWLPLLEKAPRETVVALRRLASRLGDLGDALESRDEKRIAEAWQRARSWRESLEDQR